MKDMILLDILNGTYINITFMYVIYKYFIFAVTLYMYFINDIYNLRPGKLSIKIYEKNTTNI